MIHVRAELPRPLVFALVAIFGWSAQLSSFAANVDRPTVVAAPNAAHGNFAGRIDVGRRKLYVECRGTGRPAVILESGFRTRADIWNVSDAKPPETPVFPGVATFTRVCAYDRPGTTLGANERSRSDPVPMPRLVRDAVTELHALLRASGIPGPYVIAAHSAGGLIARLYASRYPNAVASLVLVDALPEGLEPLMKPAQWRVFSQLVTQTPPELKSYRDLELIDFDRAYAEMRQANAQHPMRPLPLIVLSRGRPLQLPANAAPGFSKVLERAWRVEQDRLATLAPHAQHIIAGRSEHYIQVEQPALVTTAIRQAVEAVRAGRTAVSDHMRMRR